MDSKLKSLAIITSLIIATLILAVVLIINNKGKQSGNGTAGVNDGVSVNDLAISDGGYSAFLYDETFFDQADGDSEVTGNRMPHLYLQATSVMKDIRIAVTDENGDPVSGETFVISVSDSGDYTDVDKDGIITIPDLNAGDYYVTLGNVLGYIVPTDPMRVSVKDTLEYTVISDIEFYICSEDEIDATVEDTEETDAEQYSDATENTEIIRDGEAKFGIDVSKWQGEIDWEKVKAAGVNFVIIRAGYRGSQTGALVEDPMFREYIEGANEVGIPVGIYFFTQAVNEVEAVEEASMVVSLIEDYSVTYPIFIDTEGAGGAGRADSLDAETRTAVCSAFCETINNSGYHGGVYASRNWFNNRLNADELEDYVIWDAEYVGVPAFDGRIDLWQYSSSGYIDGISSRVDMDISYISF